MTKEEPAIRRGQLPHEKAIVCRGSLKSYVWALKKKLSKKAS